MKFWKVPLAALLALVAFNQVTPSSTDGTAKAEVKAVKKQKGAPGPVAGAGLPFLFAAGAYWLIRRRNSRSGGTDSK